MYGAVLHGCPAFGSQYLVRVVADVVSLVLASARATGRTGKAVLKNKSAALRCSVMEAGPGYLVQRLDHNDRPTSVTYLPALAFNEFSLLGQHLTTAPSVTLAKTQ